MGREVRAFLLTYGSRGDVELVVGLAVQLRALGMLVRVRAPPACAAAEGCDALVATGVMPTGGWR
jgi:vancomycin aglycone glucosyltransferase